MVDRRVTAYPGPGPDGSARAADTGWRARHDAALVGALAALLLLPGLSAIDLWAPDEPRYAQVAEELRRMPRGPEDLVVLRLNGEVYTQKPPLYFWLAAALGAGGGRVDEWAARLPSALGGVAVVALTVVLGRSLIGTRVAGVLAAVVLLATPRFLYQARRAQLDVLLTLLELVAVLAYWRIDRSEASDLRPDGRWLALLHGAVGLAILTKGPAGALPWLVIVVHRIADRRTAGLRAVFPLWGVALAAAPSLVWLVAAVALTPAGYFGDAVVDNVLARFFAGTDHVRPFWYYAVHLPLDTLPWTPAVIVGGVLAWRSRRAGGVGPFEARAARLLLSWVGVFVAFFSLSAGKRGLYMLPLLPGLAVLAAAPLARWHAAGRAHPAVVAWGAAVLGAVALAGGWLGLGAPGAPDAEALAPVPDAYAWSIVAIGVIGLACATWGMWRMRSATALGAFAASVIVFEAATLALLFPALDAEKSPRPLAAAAAAHTSPHERVGVFRNAAFAGGLAYYAGRRAVVLETARDVRDFVASGGRFVVVRPRDLAALAPGRVRHQRAVARSGRRQLVLVELGADPGG